MINRADNALRMVAQTTGTSHSDLVGAFYRRLRARLGITKSTLLQPTESHVSANDSELREEVMLILG